MLCSTCSKNQETLTAWMIHLATYHPLPTEWPSEKAKLLSDNENQRPYTVVTDSRKRRRRPTTPRPLNTFMIFSRHIRRNILSVFPDSSNSQLSKELGMLWKNISEGIKSEYENEANRLAQLHAVEFPDYKYQPKKRAQRFIRPMRERQPSILEGSSSTSGTDEERVKDCNTSMKETRHKSDVENQYIRYSILGKNILKKECQSFNSPIKNENFKKEVKESEYILNQPSPKPLNDQITNYEIRSSFCNENLKIELKEPEYILNQLRQKPLNDRITPNYDIRSSFSNGSLKIELKEPEYILNQLSQKPLNDRIANYDISSSLLRQPRPSQYNTTLYLLPSENLVVGNSGTLASQELGEDYCREFYIINDFSPENVNLDDEIDITSNIFSNELDFEWPEMDENCKQDTLISSLFQQ